MKRRFKLGKKKVNLFSFSKLIAPAMEAMKSAPVLESKCNKPIEFDFEDQFKALVFYHLDAFSSGRDFLQTVNENHLVQRITSLDSIRKSTFFEAIASRGLEQMTFIFEKLVAQATDKLSVDYKQFGQLVAIDGSLIDACLSMDWAEYRKQSKKIKLHLGLDVNRNIPKKLYFTNGKGDERPFTHLIIDEGETGIMDRYYQCYDDFDRWQKDQKQFVCRIKANAIKKIVVEHPVADNSIVFSDTEAYLGYKYINQTKNRFRVVGYEVDGIKYWIATNRFDLTAEEIADIYKLRWNIEEFFAWWKKHLKVYHVLSRNEYGFKVQLISGLITFLMLRFLCKEQDSQPLTINFVRSLRCRIFNEILGYSEVFSKQINLLRRRAALRRFAIF